MLPRVFILFCLALLAMRDPAPAQSSAGGASPFPARAFALPEGGRPVEVQLGFQFQGLNGIDDESETFEFSGILTVIWKDSRQAFDPVQAGVEEKLFHGDYQFDELSPSWYPQIVLANASVVPEKQGVVLRVKPDGTCILVETIHAVAKARLNLRKYPFDRQRLEAVFTVLGFDDTEVRLAVAPGIPSSDPSRLRIPQWDIDGIGVTTACLPATPGSPGSSQFVVGFDVSRQSLFTLRLVVLPVLLVVVLSWSVFWMERSSLGDRMGVSFVGLLTAVAYQIVVSDILPHFSYVTFINAFLNFSYWLMCATVVINLVVGELDKRGQPVRADRIDLRCRWVFPLVYAFLTAFSGAVAFAFW